MRVAQLELTFKGVDEDGERIRRDAATVATAMGLPLPRIELMLHRALRAIPLPADKDPVTVRRRPACPCPSVWYSSVSSAGSAT